MGPCQQGIRSLSTHAFLSNSKNPPKGDENLLHQKGNKRNKAMENVFSVNLWSEIAPNQEKRAALRNTVENWPYGYRVYF